MPRIIIYIITVIITSLYLFPIELKAFPGINSKMVLAAIGLVWCLCSISQKNNGEIDKGFARLSLWALAVSVIGFLSVTVNNTYDYTYATYIISMWVWLGGAYCFVNIIRCVHGRISIELITDYLIAVCVAQCFVAAAMSAYAPLRIAVDNLLGGENFMRGLENRVYGIGAALDVAGLRFAGVLAIIAFLIAHTESDRTNSRFICYLLAFLIISIMGSIIGRTTIIGAALGIVYWIFIKRPVRLRSAVTSRWFITGSVFGGIILCTIILYHTSTSFHDNIRFGFEGFFSFIETGEWRTNSTDQLINHMIVFPDNAHTWIIGDGYFDNPTYSPDKAPYFTGEQTSGFYKGTDIGYLRFIFYFGVVGLIAFVLYFINVFDVLAKRFPLYRIMFLLLITINFIGWFKVATDIFVLFAPFLCISAADKSNRLSETQ